ncbi:16S rRNA (uracil(1498)-N(3))-methyltransferase [Haliangium sp.]|uniref:16S rRNA (uracil(1498)-N(3))-methyltransferase n=1 Tax=Haliangium sp. TaxID=2663208 RepID=UPI003D13CDEB
MNLLLYERHELDGDRLVVGDRRALHLVRVLRVSPGDRVRVGLVRGPLGTGEVIAIGPESGPRSHERGSAASAAARPANWPALGPALWVELRVRTEGPAPAPPAVDLILAVPRPKALPRVIETAAAMGVGRIDLVNAWRVDKSYLHARQLAPDLLAHHARLGCEQGGLTWVPEVALHPLLMPYLSEPLSERLAAVDRALLAHPRDAVAIEQAWPPGRRGRVLLAVGPEGGWIERELASFVERGFTAVTCMEPVLRVHSAVAALLAQLALLARLG